MRGHTSGSSGIISRKRASTGCRWHWTGNGGTVPKPRGSNQCTEESVRSQSCSNFLALLNIYTYLFTVVWNILLALPLFRDSGAARIIYNLLHDRFSARRFFAQTADRRSQIANRKNGQVSQILHFQMQTLYSKAWF